MQNLRLEGKKFSYLISTIFHFNCCAFRATAQKKTDRKKERNKKKDRNKARKKDRKKNRKKERNNFVFFGYVRGEHERDRETETQKEIERAY